MTNKQLLDKYYQIAINKNKEESAILLLFLSVSKTTSSDLYIKMNENVREEVVNEFEKKVVLYLEHNEPVQYIIGEACFYGYDFNVNKDVLIPRPETEELVENVLYLYDDYFKDKKVEVADVGTGSGCIAITLALEEKNMHVMASDISLEALTVARGNAKKLGANVDFYQGDMLAPLMDKKLDILVSNPPYIPTEETVDSLVKDNEPNLALFGGNDGLKFYRVILENAPKIMNEKCILAFEHGYDKSSEIEDIARKNFPGALVYTKKDLQGLDRMTFVIRGFNNEK